MDCGSPDLDEWVAVKKNMFEDKFDEVDGMNINIQVSIQNERTTFFIKINSSLELTSDYQEVELTPKDLQNIQNQIVLMYPQIEDCFPSSLKSSFFHRPKVSSKNCLKVERYLQSISTMCGKHILEALLFDSEENDDHLCELYQENMGELKLQSLQEKCDNDRKNMEEIIELRNKCKNMLQLSAIYALEKEAVSTYLKTLSKFYKFQVRPFIDLRKVSRSKIEAMADKEGESRLQFKECQEQFMNAGDSYFDIRFKYFKKRVSIFNDHVGRMKGDEKNYGKSAFEMYGLDLLQVLELNLSSEQLEMLRCGKERLRHDSLKMQNQMLIMQPMKMWDGIAEIEKEANDIQMKIFDIKLDMLKENEVFINRKLTILHKKINDINAEGIFHDAVEDVDDAEDGAPPIVIEKQEIIRNLKEQLSKIYRHRAYLRNKKKVFVSENQKKKRLSEEKQQKYDDHCKAANKITDRKKAVSDLEFHQEERRKTLQRLRNYRVKFSKVTNGEVKKIVKKPAMNTNYLPPPPLLVESSYDESIQSLPLPPPPQLAKDKLFLDLTATTTSMDLNPTIMPVRVLPPPPPPLAEKPLITTPPTPPRLPEMPSMMVPPPPPLPPPPPPPSSLPSESGDSVKVIPKTTSKSEVNAKIAKEQNSTFSGIQLNEIMQARGRLKKSSCQKSDQNALIEVMDKNLNKKIIETNSGSSHSQLLTATLNKIRNLTAESSDDEDNFNGHHSDSESDWM